MTNREVYERDYEELEQYWEIGTVEECRVQNRVHVETALIFITTAARHATDGRR